MTISLEAIDKFIEKNRENIIADIAQLVEIPSVCSAAEEGAPFGVEARRALEKTVELSQKLGLCAEIKDNRVAVTSLEGASGEEYIATVTHADVVPAGDGWSEDAFKLRRQGGYIIGRGVMDDKGPAVLALYALKFLKELGKPLRYSVKALTGSAEEIGMEDMKYFLAHNKAPLFAFSPDAEFPVCNGEKGLYQGTLRAKFPCENILEFEGGFVLNAVPDRASALVRGELSKLSESENIELSQEERGVRINARGVAGHASRPQNTVNAIGVLVDYILKNGIATAREEKLLRGLSRLYGDTSGAGIGIAASDDRFDPLTIIGSMAGLENGRLWQSVDCRFPTSIDEERIEKGLLEAVSGLCDIERITSKKPFYIEADSAAVKACLDAYGEVTGLCAHAFTAGGGTYARAFPNAVSFGPETDVELPDFVGGIHSANEGAEEAWLLQALKIYILALCKIQDKGI